VTEIREDGVTAKTLGSHHKVLGDEADLLEKFELKVTDPNPHRRSSFPPAEGPEGSLELAAGAVLLAAGMRAKEAEALAYFGAARRVRPVGDCVKARTVEQAVKEGYFAGKSI